MKVRKNISSKDQNGKESNHFSSFFVVSKLSGSSIEKNLDKRI